MTELRYSLRRECSSVSWVVEQLTGPWGIAIHGDSVYVSCQGDDTVSKFSLTEMCLVRWIKGWGSNNRQFKSPCQLTTDSIGRVFIADYDNARICIHDLDLNHLRNITHESMSRHMMLKYHETVCTYCVPLTTHVCAY